MPTMLHEKITKAFTEAAVFTFGKMLMTDLAPQEKHGGGFAISALIGFSGGLAGSCALRMGDTAARESIGRLAGEPIEDPVEIADGIGELVNQIAGNAKAALTDYSISLAFPEVIRGEGHEVVFHRDNDIVRLSFSSDIGPIAVIVAYKDPGGNQ